MSFLKVFSTLAIATTLVATSAFADGQAMKAGKQIKVDTNGDGLISLEELSAREGVDAAKIMQRVDTNGDGFLDLAERETAKLQREDRKPTKKSVGSSGITKEDLAKRQGETAAWLIENADTDGDGLYSKDEMMAAKKLFKQTHTKPAGRSSVGVKNADKSTRTDGEKRQGHSRVTEN